MRIDPAGDKDMIAKLRQNGARGPWLRVLSAVLELAGPSAEFLHHSERPWASATFSGMRHVIGLRFTGTQAIAAGEKFIAALPDHEFVIPRQLVAEAAVTAVDHAFEPAPTLTVQAELLLLDES
ncbi:MAG: hypothetical protein N2423_08035 [Novosphingobium sp.]|nr:hypothetical protein [Novosphingobium sp.]